MTKFIKQKKFTQRATGAPMKYTDQERKRIKKERDRKRNIKYW